MQHRHTLAGGNSGGNKMNNASFILIYLNIIGGCIFGYLEYTWISVYHFCMAILMVFATYMDSKK